MRSDQEIRENQAKYERMLDEAFGLVSEDGQDARASGFAQAGEPEPMPTIMPYDEVYRALCADPQACQALQEHWTDSFQPNNLGPMPGDAAAQLRWYHLRDLNEHHHKRHKRDFEEAKKFRTQQRVETVFTRLASHDPLYKLTKDMMQHYFAQIPPSSQRALQGLLTRCPHEALEFYREIRRAAEKAVHKKHARRKQRTN